MTRDDQAEINFSGPTMSDGHSGLEKYRAEFVQPETCEPLELSFDSGGEIHLEVWRREQHDRLVTIAQREGLPIGKMVRVTLISEVELTGSLGLNSKSPDQMEVGGTSFFRSELDSCVQIDGEENGGC